MSRPRSTTDLLALCLCESEVVLVSPQQVFDGEVYCERCAPGPKVCGLCAGDHLPVDCELSRRVRARRRRAA